MTLAIIGGTGLENLAGSLEHREQKTVTTPFGDAWLTKGELDGSPLIFLARHGLTHATAPHNINYRANMRALKDEGVTNIMAAAAVGSVKNEIKPGDFVVIDQFIDFTKNRAATYSTDGEPLYHTDMTEPYDGGLRRLLMTAADAKGVSLRRGGTYVCTEGPRFETAAEIRMFQTLGGDVVGMTGVPEVVLAAELQMPYAALCIVTNYAAGLAGHGLTYEECADEMERRQATLMDVFMSAAKAGKLL